ncbi:MAG: hypothetical protein RLZZ301_642 [Bacteroidota bacterium]
MPSENKWGNTLYFPTSPSFLKDWEDQIEEAQRQFQQQEPELRAAFLRTIAQEMQNDKQHIQTLYCSESGLSVSRFESEWQRTLSTIHLFATHTENFEWSFKEHLENNTLELQKIKQAIGPVLVLGSSNFPLAYSTMGGDSVAALAAGCCVVLKSHPMHVGTCSAVTRCVQRALLKHQWPAAIFSQVVDDGYSWAQQFVQHPQLKAVAFTGSQKGGRALLDMAAQRPQPIPVFAEMGSLNPVILDPNLSVEHYAKIATELAASICTDAGQFCTKPGLILVPYHHLEPFKDALLFALDQQAVVPMLHPDIWSKYEARKREVLAIKGVERHECKVSQYGIEGRWCLGSCSLKLWIQETVTQHEVFGPFSLLASYSNTSELIPFIAQLDGQLTASVYTAEPLFSLPYFHALVDKVGRLIENGVPTGVRVSAAMHHGGPYPASSDARFSAVGPDSMRRFLKEICIQQKLTDSY